MSKWLDVLNIAQQYERLVRSKYDFIGAIHLLSQPDRYGSSPNQVLSMLTVEQEMDIGFIRFADLTIQYVIRLDIQEGDNQPLIKIHFSLIDELGSEEPVELVTIVQNGRGRFGKEGESIEKIMNQGDDLSEFVYELLAEANSNRFTSNVKKNRLPQVNKLSR
ncbi:MAG TPA: hypothetical protein VIM93_00430 [Kangiella sp.]